MKKKLLALLLASCMVFAVAACGKTESTENTDAATEANGLGTSTITELGEYKGLNYAPYDTTVTDEEVEAEIQFLVANSSTKNPQETATETSVVNIDYVGKKDGVAFEGGTAEGQELDLGNSTYIAGFAESIVGMKVGETKDCPMKFPEDYGVEELNGADVVFTITVNECWENVPAELNDEFAVSQGYENVDGLYAGMRQLCELTKEQNAQNDMKMQLVEKMIAGSTFDITEEEIAYYVEQMKAEAEMYASYYGYDLAGYVEAMGTTMEEFEAGLREDAIYRIQTALLQDRIVEEEKIGVSEEEYKNRAEVYMTYYGYATMEEFETAYTKELIERQVRADLAMEAVMGYAVAE